MKKLITLLCFLMSFALIAQEKVVEGQVISGEDDLPLIGVSILAKGSSVGTITDFDGNYALSIPDGIDTLQFSYTGFATQEILIGDQTRIDLVLLPSSELLEEVVVIGYGVQKKRVATGSISKLSKENLEGYQVQNVQSALEGQVAGLIVSESSGQPGASQAILIRGISTNGDNTPLFVVDGLQLSSIDNINPNDIESVDVLKDAASCAIYGARGANGVVIITTKKGTDIGGEMVYEVFRSTANPWRLPTMLGANDYIALTREKFANANQTNSLNTLGFPQVGEVATNTNWMDVIFNPANTTSHRLSASAKNMFLSLEYWDQNGVVGAERSNYQRYSARMNSRKEINDYLTIGENIVVNRVNNQNIGINSAFGTVISDAFAYDPITAVNDESAQYGFAQSQWVQKEYINPLSRLFIINADGHGDQILGNVFAEYKPIPKLRFRTDFGMEYGYFKFRSFTPNYNFHPAFVNPSNDVSQGYGYYQNLQFENYVNYLDTIGGKHHFDVILGTSYREARGDQAGGSSQFIPTEVQFDENFQILDAGQDTIDLAYGSVNVDYKLASIYGRLLYNYDDKYLFSATLRRDGSSNFGSNNRFGVFPSFSVGWVMSDEPFMNLGAINFMKIRASWGINGNDRISPLAYASRVENAFSYPFGVNQSLEQGSALATPPNPNIKWEESRQLDIGLEIHLWDDKLTAEIDYYIKDTKDLLMGQLIPGYIGATNNPISNLGEIRNTGIETAISYRFNIGGVRFTTGLSYTTFNNEVISVAGDGFLEGWSWPVRNQAITRMTEGLPVGHFVGYQTDGIFQSQEEVFSHISSSGDLLQPAAAPGDIRFVDINGDGVINTDDITDIGSPWPDHIIGLTFSANYKGFSMSAVLGTQIGHDIYRTYERSDVTYTNYQDFWLDRWTPDNPSGTLPRLTSTDPNNNQRPSDFYVEDGSFLRLRNFQFGYDLPQSLLSKAKIKGIKVYFSANNLFTFTNYRGFDPEIGTSGWILDTGIDKGFYPSNRSLGGGVKVTL